MKSYTKWTQTVLCRNCMRCKFRFYAFWMKTLCEWYAKRMLYTAFVQFTENSLRTPLRLIELKRSENLRH